MEVVTTFHGVDGAKHTIGYVRSRAGGRDENGVSQGGAMTLLCDLWQGHGLRLLAAVRTDDGDGHIKALVRDYRIEASSVSRPLSRRVELMPQSAETPIAV